MSQEVHPTDDKNARQWDKMNIKDCEKLVKQFRDQYANIITKDFYEIFPRLYKKIKEVFDEVLIEQDQLFKRTYISHMIPVPPPVFKMADKIKKEPEENWSKINAGLKCEQIRKRPNFIPPGDSIMPTNMRMNYFIDKILQLCYELKEEINDLIYALTLQLPKMKDGEHVGTALMDDCLLELSTMSKELNTMANRFSKYPKKRGDLILLVLRNPHIEDHRIRLDSFDINFRMNIYKIFDELIRKCLITYIMFKNNYEELNTFVTINSYEDNDQIVNLYY